MSLKPGRIPHFDKCSLPSLFVTCSMLKLLPLWVYNSFVKTVGTKCIYYLIWEAAKFGFCRSAAVRAIVPYKIDQYKMLFQYKQGSSLKLILMKISYLKIVTMTPWHPKLPKTASLP